MRGEFPSHAQEHREFWGVGNGSILYPSCSGGFASTHIG